MEWGGGGERILYDVNRNVAYLSFDFDTVTHSKGHFSIYFCFVLIFFLQISKFLNLCGSRIWLLIFFLFRPDPKIWFKINFSYPTKQILSFKLCFKCFHFVVWDRTFLTVENNFQISVLYMVSHTNFRKLDRIHVFFKNPNLDSTGSESATLLYEFVLTYISCCFSTWKCLQRKRQKPGLLFFVIYFYFVWKPSTFLFSYFVVCHSLESIFII